MVSPIQFMRPFNTHTHIHHNYFKDIQSSRVLWNEENGMEAIQIGQNVKWEYTDVYTVVEHNLFENVIGEGAEIISVKTSRNIIRNNTFRNSPSMLTLRQGHHNTVEGNFFINTKSGIRVYGDGHFIANNYIINSARNAIEISGGRTDRHNVPVTNSVIINNTVINPGGSGIFYNAAKHELVPTNNSIINNFIMLGPTSGKAIDGNGDSGTVYANNLVASESPETVGVVTRGIDIIAPENMTQDGELLRPTQDSALIDYGQDYPGLIRDMDGQVRNGNPDCGADEVSDEPVRNHPLTAVDVGVKWTVDQPKRVYIDSPGHNQVIGPNQPVVIRVDPGILPTEVVVRQDDIVVYHGQDLPGEFALALESAADGTSHRLSVHIVDERGVQYDQSADFIIKRLTISDILGMPAQTASGLTILQGDVNAAIRMSLHLAQQEVLDDMTVSLRPVVADDQSFRETVLYQGDMPIHQLCLNTREFDDGVYDLVFSIATNRGVVSTETRRIMIRNWVVLNDTLQPPIDSGWLGVVDRLETMDRSDGWVFVGDDSQAFFNDTQRLVTTGNNEEYLTWKMPRLHHFTFTLYAQDADIGAAVAVAVSPDGNTWQGVTYNTMAIARSDAGWIKMTINGELPTEASASYM